MKTLRTFLAEAKFNETVKIPLTKEESKLIGSLRIYKEKYKLDRTQSNYRYDNHRFSPAFAGGTDLAELKQLISKVKKA